MKLLENGLLFVFALAIALAVWATYGTRPAAGFDVQMAPAPCYEVVGERVTKTGIHLALIFNQCEPGFKWLKTPTPPDAEA
jgi:hypothetical protein